MKVICMSLPTITESAGRYKNRSHERTVERTDTWEKSTAFLRSAVIFTRTAAHICLFSEIYRLFITFDSLFRASITGYLPEAPHFCPSKMRPRPDHASVILFLSYFISLLNEVLTSEVESNGSSFTWDTRGYVFYCPCMGR